MTFHSIVVSCVLAWAWSSGFAAEVKSDSIPEVDSVAIPKAAPSELDQLAIHQVYEDGNFEKAVQLRGTALAATTGAAAYLITTHYSDDETPKPITYAIPH